MRRLLVALALLCTLFAMPRSARAYVPATVIYEGKRAAKARTQTTTADPGFHAYRVECKACGNAAEHMSSCPLCALSS